ncbi:MAG: hypothetical protein M1819_001090 [Sarea resinae]|nr:MAG: hypothetical protein M1819_001090 [Sarea resinae]
MSHRGPYPQHHRSDTPTPARTFAKQSSNRSILDSPASLAIITTPHESGAALSGRHCHDGRAGLASGGSGKGTFYCSEHEDEDELDDDHEEEVGYCGGYNTHHRHDGTLHRQDGLLHEQDTTHAGQGISARSSFAAILPLRLTKTNKPANQTPLSTIPTPATPTPPHTASHISDKTTKPLPLPLPLQPPPPPPPPSLTILPPPRLPSRIDALTLRATLHARRLHDQDTLLASLEARVATLETCTRDVVAAVNRNALVVRGLIADLGGGGSGNGGGEGGVGERVVTHAVGLGEGEGEIAAAAAAAGSEMHETGSAASASANIIDDNDKNSNDQNVTTIDIDKDKTTTTAHAARLARHESNIQQLFLGLDECMTAGLAHATTADIERLESRLERLQASTRRRHAQLERIQADTERVQADIQRHQADTENLRAATERNQAAIQRNHTALAALTTAQAHTNAQRSQGTPTPTPTPNHLQPTQTTITQQHSERLDRLEAVVPRLDALQTQVLAGMRRAEGPRAERLRAEVLRAERLRAEVLRAGMEERRARAGAGIGALQTRVERLDREMERVLNGAACCCCYGKEELEEVDVTGGGG